MNYLAHIFLANNKPYSIVGNLMGDFLKGVDLTKLPDEVVKGIRNHQAVDQFTDNHLQIRQLKNHLSPARRRYSGIITDVVFDYFLIKYWHLYSKQSFNHFVDETYRCLMNHLYLMPSKMNTIIQRMVQMDWFRSYADIQTLEIVFDRMSERIRFKNYLSGALEEVIDNYGVFEVVFLEFFPQLISHVEKIKIEK